MKAYISKVENKIIGGAKAEQPVSIVSVINTTPGRAIGGGCHSYGEGQHGLYIVIGSAPYGGDSGYIDLVMSRDEMVALRDALTVGIDTIIESKEVATVIKNEKPRL